MTTKLALYKSALAALGSAPIAALSDADERRYAIDEVYSDVLNECLEEGQWNFAQKSVEIASNPSVDPTFGFQYAFTQPDDYVRLTGISGSEFFYPPLDRYHTEAGYWWADIDPIYVCYVSSATDYGLDLSKWSNSFARYVYLTLAERVCLRLTQSDNKYEIMMKLADKAKKRAKSNDAMNQPSPVIPQGDWLNSRFGTRSYRKRGERAL